MLTLFTLLTQLALGAPTTTTPAERPAITVPDVSLDTNEDGTPSATDIPAVKKKKKRLFSALYQQGNRLTPKHRLWYSSFLTGRINPLGLQETLTIGYRGRLMPKTGSFFGDTYAFIGGEFNVSPAFARAGVRFETSPIAMVIFGASYHFIGYFSSFGQMLSFQGTDVDYSDSTQDTLAAGGGNYATTGGVGQLDLRVQAKAGPIAIRNTSKVQRWDLKLTNGDDTFWDIVSDLLVRNNGWTFQNDLDLLGVKGRTSFGVRYTYAEAFHPKGSTGDGVIPIHRVGPLVAFKFHDWGPGYKFNTPTIFLLAQWHAQHAYRTGQDVSVAIPWVVIGFFFSGDLATSGP